MANPEKSFKRIQFQMNGAWLPNVSPLHVGAQNFVKAINVRPTESGWETVEGFTKINTTPTDTPINLHHYSKEDETHVIAKIYDGSVYELFDNTTAIPSQGDFTATALKEVSSGIGSFTNGPQGTMLYADAQNNLIWGGDEMRPNTFLTSDDSDADGARDFSNNVNSSREDTTVQVGSGLDSLTVCLLHGEGADASTTITDSSTGGVGSPHTFTAQADAQIDTDEYKYGVASIYLDGTGDYVNAPDSADWNFGSGDGCIEMWVKIQANGGLIQQYDDADNCLALYQVLGTLTQDYTFIVRSSASTIVTLTGSHAFFGMDWHHIAVTKEGTTCRLFIDGVLKDTDTATGAFPDLAGTLDIGLRSYGATDYAAGHFDEVRIVKGSAVYTAAFTPPQTAFGNDARYMFIGSPLKLNGIKAYIDTPNTETATMSGAVWGGSAWQALTLTDNTADTGVTLAQDGTVTWGYTESAKVRYLNGETLYWYRFDLNGVEASLYRVTVSAPLQNIRDIWNGSPRTCTSFQFYDSPVFIDYTFQVTAKDSTDDSIYAADIGGMSQTNDYILIIFDERTMGIKFDMLSSNVNAAAIKISSVQYWDGLQYQSVGSFVDGTLDSGSTSSFGKSGVVSWSPVSTSQEFAQEIFGVKGYAYKIALTGAVTVTAGTSIDSVTGIPSPLEISGYDKVGTYNGRAMLINGNRVMFSQTDYPWVYNGVDASDEIRFLDFGKEDDIVTTASIFNRYGSNLIESWVVLKKNSTYILTGSQPYRELSEPFIKKQISQNIGCAAPLTVGAYDMDLGNGLRMGVVVWLDFSGPIVFNGAVPTKIPGVENYFDPTKDECINYSYIDLSIGYIDTVHSQWNLIFPSGSGATANNKWIVFDFKLKKWFEKAPNVGDVVLWDDSGDAVLWDASGDAVLWDEGQYPVVVTPVEATSGARYNYGFLSTGYMMRLDNGSVWDGRAIAQQLRTGIFSPPMIDELGFWSKSRLRGVRLISEAIDEENRDVLVSILNDGVLSDNSLSVELDSGGVISKNSRPSANFSEEADYYQLDFTTQTSVDKWRPLSAGYEAQFIRED